jgi:oligopeptide transport system ATP-binding protein
VLSGEIPSPETPPTGCHFHPRCSLAMDICAREYPKVRIVDGAEVSCHLYPE